MKQLIRLTCILTVITAAQAAERKVTLTVGNTPLKDFRQVAQLAKDLGANHVRANDIEPAMWQWNLNRYDPYPNWGLKNPTIFKFVVPDELKKFLPADYAKRNLNALKERGKILREFGLKASFRGMEPAYLPEAVYRAHPAWRGPRCDQARRARTEYYAPCFDNPEVRAMYFKAVKKLCEACPFDAFVLLTNDSGGGLCWAEGLYAGENGPFTCKDIPIGERITTYLSVFQDAAKAAGLGDVYAQVHHIGAGDVARALPYLKPGQSVNGLSAEGKSTMVGVGVFDYGEETFPVWGLPRMGRYATGLQRLAQAPAEAHVAITFRSLESKDEIDFVKTYLGKIGPGEAAKYRAIEDFAATRIGKEDAVTLAGIWNAIDEVALRVGHLETGGQIFMLGTVHQRWLTRPFVAFPNELKPVEKDYYRTYQFQAQSEAIADDMSDLQGHQWLKGYGAVFQLNHVVQHLMPTLTKAEKTAYNLAEKYHAHTYGEELKLLALRLTAFKYVIMNAKNAVAFQEMMDRADRTNPPHDKSPHIRDQGDNDLVVINQLVRDEIDMSYRLADLIDHAPGRVFWTASTPAFTSVMCFEPDLSASLRKRATIMENHRRDFLRLYMSRNR